jgi:HAD superfamily hydrolase (TIGR01509 family)
LTTPALPRRVDAVVFDMDGILFDTESLYERAAVAAAKELGYEMTTEFFRSTVGSPWVVIRGQLLEFYGPTFDADRLFAITMRLFEEWTETQLSLKPGVLELLDLLDELKLPRAIATSSPHATVQRHLKTHDLAQRFDHVVALGDCARHKPAPDPFLLAAERLGVLPAHCLALEDSHHGVQAAAAAGMMTIMVPDLLAPTDELRTLCTHVLEDLHRVCPLVDFRKMTKV